VGDEAEGPNPVDPRAAAAAAAEHRVFQAKQRDTKGGKLAKKLAEQKGRDKQPSPELPDRLVWD